MKTFRNSNRNLIQTFSVASFRFGSTVEGKILFAEKSAGERTMLVVQWNLDLCIYVFVYFCFLYLCICVFVYSCICEFVYLCICIFVYLCICKRQQEERRMHVYSGTWIHSIQLEKKNNSQKVYIHKSFPTHFLLATNFALDMGNAPMKEMLKLYFSKIFFTQNTKCSR